MHAPEANAAFSDEGYMDACIDFAKAAAERGTIVALRLWNLGTSADNSEILDRLRVAFPCEWGNVRCGGSQRLSDRVFLEWGERFEWLQVIGCLKKTGMQLRDIKTFIEMAMQGDQTIEPRLALITKQKESVEAQIAELEETLRTLEFKEWYYNTAKENGTTSVPRNMTLDELPEEFREVRLKLRGE